jgi:hypothetical protein
MVSIFLGLLLLFFKSTSIAVGAVSGAGQYPIAGQHIIYHRLFRLLLLQHDDRAGSFGGRGQQGKHCLRSHCAAAFDRCCSTIPLDRQRRSIRHGHCRTGVQQQQWRIATFLLWHFLPSKLVALQFCLSHPDSWRRPQGVLIDAASSSPAAVTTMPTVLYLW